MSDSRLLLSNEEPILKVEDLQVEFVNRRGRGRALDGVSFELRRGETLGLVGESGSGKSVTSLAILGLLPKPMSRVTGGRVLFDGEDLLTKSPNELRSYRGKHISMVLQDPMTALNPVFTIGKQLAEPLKLHQKLHGKALRDRSIELLRLLRIPSPESRLAQYPHQFSGGMRQRVVGAIALAASPDVLIADEPTTALDVTIQAAYLELLKDVQRETNLGILFITHDMGVVGDMCDRVAVMYSGRIVEVATTRKIFAMPKHPYTRALMESVPDVRKAVSRLVSIEGAPPSIYDAPPGCRFHTRCWLFKALGEPESCRTIRPELVPDAEGTPVACHFPEESVKRSPRAEDVAVAVS